MTERRGLFEAMWSAPETTPGELRRFQFDLREATRYRLDVKRPGAPLLPESFHHSHEAAFDAGLLVVTGQRAFAREPRSGWDFVIRDQEGLLQEDDG